MELCEAVYFVYACYITFLDNLDTASMLYVCQQFLKMTFSRLAGRCYDAATVGKTL